MAVNLYLFFKLGVVLDLGLVHHAGVARLGKTIKPTKGCEEYKLSRFDITLPFLAEIPAIVGAFFWYDSWYR